MIFWSSNLGISTNRKRKVSLFDVVDELRCFMFDGGDQIEIGEELAIKKPKVWLEARSPSNNWAKA